MGRFMSPDWSASPSAVPYAQLGVPQSLNLYAYVDNNPMNSVDISGHADEQWLEEHAPQVAEADAREEGVYGGAAPSQELQNAAANSRAAQQNSGEGGGILGKIKEGVGMIRDGVKAFQEGRNVKLWLAAAQADKNIIDNYDPITDRDTDLTLVHARYAFEFAKSAEYLITLGMDFESKASSFGTPDTVTGVLGKIATNVATMGINIAEAGYKASFDKNVKMAEQVYIQALEAHQ